MNLTCEQKTEPRRAIVRLLNLKAKFGRLGVIKTMHALESAVTKCGYELAGMLPEPTNKEIRDGFLSCKPFEQNRR